jgi:hypothetical protein
LWRGGNQVFKSGIKEGARPRNATQKAMERRYRQQPLQPANDGKKCQVDQIFHIADLEPAEDYWSDREKIQTLNCPMTHFTKEPWQSSRMIAHVQILNRSLERWTGRKLVAGDGPAAEQADRLFDAPFVVVSHGLESDPVLNYGNATALTLWEMTWEELTRTPSRLTAEAPNREERARLLAAVTRDGFIDDYSGVRISQTGRRFRIQQATVWNLLGPDDKYYGQAAMFSRWEFI